MPFYSMREVELEQPIFGANYIKGKVISEQNGESRHVARLTPVSQKETTVKRGQVFCNLSDFYCRKLGRAWQVQDVVQQRRCYRVRTGHAEGWAAGCVSFWLLLGNSVIATNEVLTSSNGSRVSSSYVTKRSLLVARCSPFSVTELPCAAAALHAPDWGLLPTSAPGLRATAGPYVRLRALADVPQCTAQ